MAVSQSQIVDLLYKEAFGVTKTDTATNKSPSNESIPSPALNRGDTVWTQSDQIPGTAAATAGIVQAYVGVDAVECSADNTTVPIGGIYPTWLTNLTYWIPTEFGSTYNVQVWVDSPGVADPTATGTQIFADGSGGTGQYYYNYQSGVLNFIGETIPASLTSGKVLYIVGYRYIGLVGVTNLPDDTQIGNLSFTGANISSTETNANINLTPNGTGVLTSSANVYAPTFFGNLQGNISGNITVGGSNTQVLFNDGGLIGANGNFTFNKATALLTVDGALSVTGTGSFGGNVNLNNQWINNVANPSVATDAATKQYVDDAVSAGLTIHTPVLVESPDSAGSLNATYADGGTTQIVTTITGNKTLQFGTSPALAVNDVIVFASTTNGLTAGTAYFVYSTNGSNQVTLSATYDGVEITSLTNGTGLSISSLANSGVGATLTSNVNEVLIIDGVTMTGSERVLIYNQTNAYENGVYVVTDAGSGSTPWILTRSSDTDTYGPKNTDQLDIGDYFFVQDGDTGAGESYVCTAPNGVIIFGTTNITFTQFSASQVYEAGDGLTLTNTTFSVNTSQPNVTSVGTLTSLSVSGNANIGNIGTAGLITATGNLNAGNIITGGIVSATGNGTFGNIDTAGLVTVTGNITGGNLITGGVVTATGNITGANLVTGGVLTVTGNANIGNIGTGGLILATGNITGGNLITGGVVTATGNISGANLNASYGVDTANLTVSANANIGNIGTGGLITATGNIDGGNLNTGGVVSATGNIDGGNLNTGGLITATGNITGGNLVTGGVISATGNANVGNLGTTGVFATTLSSTGNANIGNIGTAGLITATGNIGGGNLVTGGVVTATGNITGGNLTTAGVISATGNATVGNITTTGLANVGSLTVTGVSNLGPISNVTITGGSANYLLQTNGSGALTWVAPPSTSSIVNGTSNVSIPTADGNVNTSVDGNANVFVVTGTGANVAGTLSSSGNLNAGNIITAGIVSATGNGTFGNISTTGSGGNISGANVVSANTFTATANITGGNLITGGVVTATGNITGGNLTTAGVLSVTGNANIGNIGTAGLITATGNIQGANLVTGGVLSVTGNANIGNIGTAGVITATGNITGGNINTANAVLANTITANISANIGNTQVGWGTVTTTAITANQTIVEFSTTGIAAIEFLVKGEDSAGDKYSVATVTAVTDGTNVDFATYATAFLTSGTGALAVNISGGNVALQVTPASSNSTVWTTQYRVM